MNRYQTFNESWIARVMASLCLLVGFSHTVAAEMEPLPQGAWTMVVIPDTQFYSANEEMAPIFTEMTQWMVANQQTRNIQLVLHVGDIVNKNTIEKEWVSAKASMQVLDGKLPYVLAVGNHDLGERVSSSSRLTKLNDYFKISDNPLNQKLLGGCFKEGELENAWYRFSYGGLDAIVFSLEFGPRKEVVDWANSVASQHKDLSMILVTHEFIDQESSLFSVDGLPRRTTPQTTNNPHQYGIAKNATVYCGSELWEAFVSKYPKFDLVVNGHYKAFQRIGNKKNGRIEMLKDLTSAYRSDQNSAGNLTHQMLFNAQWAARGGNGWIRLLEFQPDGKTVNVKTFSPYLERTAVDKSEAWRRNPACEFSFELKRSAPASISN